MKTHSGAKKRFKLSARGKLSGRHAFTSHIREKKSSRRKRRLDAPVALAREDYGRVRKLLLEGKGR